MPWHLPDWITGYDAENAARAAVADAELRRLNELAAANGRYTAEQIRQIEQDYRNQDGFTETWQRDQIGDAFEEGLDEGRAGVNSFIGGALGQFLKSVPTILWVALVLYVFFWLGGFAWLTRKGKAVFQ